VRDAAAGSEGAPEGRTASEAIAAARRAVASREPPETRPAAPSEPPAVERDTTASADGRSGAASAPPELGLREDWQAVLERLDLGGVASELARNCELDTWDGERLILRLDPSSQRLRVDAAEQRLLESLRRVFGEGVKVEIRVCPPRGETPSQRRRREQAERQAAAEAAFASDPVVDAMRTELGARVLPGTIAPSDSRPPHGGGSR
jgi:DNA polymerase-3 subunit gamma/tau